ncbi:MAG: RluA family pseudouridine synthase [Clostridia bacterium]|nr:RluA family pseudouridine synthase [Clostridia bacterium]
MEYVSFVVKNAGCRLDAAVTEELEDVTRSFVQNLIGKGLVSVNGKPESKNGYSLREGDTVDVTIPDPVGLSVEPEDIPVQIVYEDEDMMVVNKQQGLVVHPSVGTPSGTLVNALLNLEDHFSSINGVIRPGIVHRLDKNTSGLLVVAKNDKAHLSLAEQIATKDAKRYYIALLDGNLKEDEGVVNQPIGRSPRDRKQMAVVEGGKSAETHWKVLKRYGQYTLAEFELKTGRTHQIRVHAKYLHHPVVGDDVYGGSNKFGLAGQLLHAYKLVVTQPTTGERLTFEAPLPDYFQAVLAKLDKSLG